MPNTDFTVQFTNLRYAKQQIREIVESGNLDPEQLMSIADDLEVATETLAEEVNSSIQEFEGQIDCMSSSTSYVQSI